MAQQEQNILKNYQKSLPNNQQLLPQQVPYDQTVQLRNQNQQQYNTNLQQFQPNSEVNPMFQYTQQNLIQQKFLMQEQQQPQQSQLHNKQFNNDKYIQYQQQNPIYKGNSVNTFQYSAKGIQNNPNIEEDPKSFANNQFKTLQVSPQQNTVSQQNNNYSYFPNQQPGHLQIQQQQQLYQQKSYPNQYQQRQDKFVNNSNNTIQQQQFPNQQPFQPLPPNIQEKRGNSNSFPKQNQQITQDNKQIYHRNNSQYQNNRNYSPNTQQNKNNQPLPPQRQFMSPNQRQNQNQGNLSQPQFISNNNNNNNNFTQNNSNNQFVNNKHANNAQFSNFQNSQSLDSNRNIQVNNQNRSFNNSTPPKKANERGDLNRQFQQQGQIQQTQIPQQKSPKDSKQPQNPQQLNQGLHSQIQNVQAANSSQNNFIANSPQPLRHLNNNYQQGIQQQQQQQNPQINLQINNQYTTNQINNSQQYNNFKNQKFNNFNQNNNNYANNNKQKFLQIKKDPVIDSPEEIRKWTENRKLNYPCEANKIRKENKNKKKKQHGEITKPELSILESRLRKKMVVFEQIDGQNSYQIQKQMRIRSQQLESLKKFYEAGVSIKRGKKNQNQEQKYSKIIQNPKLNLALMKKYQYIKRKSSEYTMEELIRKKKQLDKMKHRSKKQTKKQLKQQEKKLHKNYTSQLLQSSSINEENEEEIPAEQQCVTETFLKTQKKQQIKPVAQTHDEIAQNLISQLTQKQEQEESTLKYIFDYRFNSSNFKYQTNQLLSSLLVDEIYKERNAILQAIRYIVNRKFFEQIKDVSSPEYTEDENESDQNNNNNLKIDQEIQSKQHASSINQQDDIQNIQRHDFQEKQQQTIQDGKLPQQQYLSEENQNNYQEQQQKQQQAQNQLQLQQQHQQMQYLMYQQQIDNDMNMDNNEIINFESPQPGQQQIQNQKNSTNENNNDDQKQIIEQMFGEENY